MPGMRNTMREYSEGTLRSGSKKGPVVKSRAQAIAIGLDEERRAGVDVPKKRKKSPSGKKGRTPAPPRSLAAAAIERGTA